MMNYCAMRVAHITPVFPPYRGGMGNVAFHEAEALAAEGVSVTVFTGRTTEPPRSPRGVEVRTFSPLLRSGNAACIPQVLRSVRDYDLIELHYPFFGTAEPLALRRLVRGPPLVLRYHMDVVGRGLQAAVFRWHRRIVFPFVVRAADAVAVTSLDYATASTFLAPRLSSLRSRLHEVPGGVDTARFHPAGSDAELRARLATGDGPLVLCLGGLDAAHYFKGVEVLLAAMRELPNATLVVGGDGSLRHHYEAQARRLGLADRVRFAGNISDDELPAYYRAADVVTLPSIDRTEAFGLVLLEAMASATPVVASRLPGVSTLVEDERNGYLAEPGNAHDLAAKIARCTRRSSELGAYARRFVEQRYTWPAIAQRLIRLYNRLTGN